VGRKRVWKLLQRGRARGSAERRRGRPPRSTRACFNVAALGGARRDAPRARAEAPPKKLQRGRARGSAESILERAATTRWTCASTWPRSGERGEERERGGRAVRGQSFNVAALGGARRGGCAARAPALKPPASTWPRSGERGECRGCPRASWPARSFNVAALGGARRVQRLGKGGLGVCRASTWPRSGERGEVRPRRRS